MQFEALYYDEELDKVVTTKLDNERLIVEDEDDNSNEEDLSFEYDIKNGWVKGNATVTPALINAPLIYETNVDGDAVDTIERNPHLEDHYRGAEDAFNVLFTNYILTLPMDTALSAGRVKKRFWYNLSSGALVGAKGSSKGLRLHQGVLGRDGKLERVESLSVLPNVYSSGDTCHGDLQGVREYRERTGKTSDDVDVLATSYALFQSGVGNDDLKTTRGGVRVSYEVLVDILTRFKDGYVASLEDDEAKSKLEHYIIEFRSWVVNRIERYDEDINYFSINKNQLGAILNVVDGYYIEDFL